MSIQYSLKRLQGKKEYKINPGILIFYQRESEQDMPRRTGKIIDQCVMEFS